MNAATGSRPRMGWLAAAVLVAIVLRAALLMAALHASGFTAILAGDSSSYLQPARNLFQHACFCNAQGPEIDRTPGYPLFIAFTGSLSGKFLGTIAAQILLSALSLLLASRIASRLFASERAGLAAAWFMAIEPLSVEYSVRILSETLFVFLLLLFLSIFLDWLREPSLRRATLMAATLAAMAYTRPVAYWLFVPVLILACFALPTSRSRSQIASVAVFAAGFLLLVMPWQIRNLAQADYGGFSSIADKNLYFYVAGDILAQQQHLPLETWQTSVGKDDPARWLQIHPEQQSWPQSARNRWLRASAIQTLQAHPVLFLESYLRGELRLLFAPGASEWFRLLHWNHADPASSDLPIPRSSWSLGQWAVAAVFEWILLALNGLTGWSLRQRKTSRRLQWVFIAVAAYFLAVSGGGQAVSRLRLPVMALLCILAAGGWDALCFRKESSGKRTGDPGRI